MPVLDQDIPPYLHYEYRPSDIAAVGTTFNVYSNEKVLAQDSNTSPTRQRADAVRATPQAWVVIYVLQ